ncbi:hypothetical protein J6590_081343 [Homalodisca vitripennis]|nr:hypothetical protein J6590_081343 [Homalodisca vitripennis]
MSTSTGLEAGTTSDSISTERRLMDAYRPNALIRRFGPWGTGKEASSLLWEEDLQGYTRSRPMNVAPCRTMRWSPTLTTGTPTRVLKTSPPPVPFKAVSDAGLSSGSVKRKKGGRSGHGGDQAGNTTTQEIRNSSQEESSSYGIRAANASAAAGRCQRTR